MCGIIGIFNIENAQSIILESLKIIRYRGLDNIGIATRNELKFSNDFESFSLKKSENTLGHLLHSGTNIPRQPLKGKGFFASDCQIYNWKDLAKKYGIEAKNDSELLLWMFEKNLLPEKIEEVDGDYAFAYWKDNEVIIARDIIGIKPIWFSTKRQSQPCFAFASEKKALEKTGFQEIEELNPREIIFYNIKENKLSVKKREYFSILPEHQQNYETQKNKVLDLLTDAVEKRISDEKIGLLFSGGIDSTFLALLLKRLGADFICYTAALESEKEAEDIVYAKRVSEFFGLNLKIITIKLEQVEDYIRKIIPLIEDSNVIKVGVALPFYLCCEEAKKDGIKLIFSGLGSEEIFAGYERHKKSENVNEECYLGLLKIYERDLYRDNVVTMANSIELRTPFLDRNLVDYALKIPSEYKLNKEQNKLILRDAAKIIGVPPEFAERKKRAAQYGSRFDKAIEKLAAIKKFRTKSEYLDTFCKKPNLKLGVLFSSGKDSTYAAYLMKKQNYDISCLITIKSKNPESFMFHTPMVEIAELQAEAMNIPIILRETEGEKEAELKDLEDAIKEAKEKYKIDGIVTGALFSDYQRSRIEKICEKLGLKVFSPLWHMDQEKEMREIIDSGFEIVMTAVAAEGLDKKWLMKPLSHKDIDRLVELNKKYKINIAGEGGEFETLVLNCPLFNKRINIKNYEIIEGKNSARVIIK